MKKLLSVNVALPRMIEVHGKQVPTGIYKLPVSGPVRVHKLGLEGDGQADLTVHGGEFQALYGYPIEHYAHWENEMGVSSYAPGTFGENVTTSGLLETEVCIGDVHRMGGVVLQVTGHRLPCFKFAHKLQRPDILKPFLQSGYSGFYYKVMQEGVIAAGDEITVLERDPRGVTVRALLGAHRMGENVSEVVTKALEIPSLASFVRRDFQEKMESP